MISLREKEQFLKRPWCQNCGAYLMDVTLDILYLNVVGIHPNKGNISNGFPCAYRNKHLIFNYYNLEQKEFKNG